MMDLSSKFVHIQLMQLAGIHHVTAVTAKASDNLNFYTRVLGMRLVKKTVNQDDVSAYHLFYADGVGTPGSDFTFFDWPASPERRGTGSVVRTGLRVAGEEVLEWWRKRFEESGVKHEPIADRDGCRVLDFEDPEGQRLSLVDDGGTGAAHPWDESPVSADRQIRGLGPVTISVRELGPTALILTNLLNMRMTREYSHSGDIPREVFVYEMGEGGPAAELHVMVESKAPAARVGAGGLHHVAFRAPGFTDHEKWVKHLEEMRVPSSGPVDRFYFKSLYFREPSGILFEIATDEPGFTADEPLERLGQGLALPPFLEPRRMEIEGKLKPL